MKAKLPEELQRLPFEMEAAIFRVVQESLTNIYRTPAARLRGQSKLERKGETVRVKIRDYGESSGADKAGAEGLAWASAECGNACRGWAASSR